MKHHITTTPGPETLTPTGAQVPHTESVRGNPLSELVLAAAAKFSTAVFVFTQRRAAKNNSTPEVGTGPQRKGGVLSRLAYMTVGVSIATTLDRATGLDITTFGAGSSQGEGMRAAGFISGDPAWNGGGNYHTGSNSGNAPSVLTEKSSSRSATGTTAPTGEVKTAQINDNNSGATNAAEKNTSGSTSTTGTAPAPEHASSGYNPDYNPGSADSVTTAPAPEQSASGYNPDTATGLDSGDADETKTSGTGEVNDNNSGATNAAEKNTSGSTSTTGTAPAPEHASSGYNPDYNPGSADSVTTAPAPEQSASGYNPDTATAETDTDTGMTVEAIMEQTKDTVPTSFTVKSGDTLSEMSLTHLKQLQKEAGLEGDISMEQLTKYYELVAKSNGIDNPDLIHPGKVIKFGEADKALMSGIFEGVEAPKAETAAEEVAKQELPADIKAAAEKEASAAVEALQIPTPEELAKSLDASKFTNGQGLYDYFAKHGVPEAVRQDVMQAWLANDEIRALLTEGENPLMYIYEGTNGAELRLSAPHELTVSEQEVIVSAYKQVNPAVIAAEHQGFMAERAAKLLKIDDLDPDEYDLAA